MIERIHVDGSKGSTVAQQIGLPVTLDIQGLNLQASLDGFFKDARSYRLSFEGDLFGKGDVYRE
jgi:hypothetical protein